MKKIFHRPSVRSAASWWLAFLLAIFLFLSGTASAATLTGVITNALTGTGIVGVRITVNGNVTYSVSSGVYSLTVEPAGTYPVSCAKTGFDLHQSSPINFQQGATVIYNIVLQENTNPAGNVLSALNAGTQSVDVNWSVPVGAYELLYDDGMQDNFTVWAIQGNMNGVKFTPPAYPAVVKGGSVNIGTASNYPSGSNPLVPFQISVYKADGIAGMPGTLIGGPFDIVPLHYGWVEFSFPASVQVTGGSFYLVMIQGGNAPNAAGIAVDETFPVLRSVQRFATGGGSWIPAGGNFMMRAIAEGTGGPVDLDGGEDALQGYQVWRLQQGEEQNPAVWVDLGTTLNTSINDPGWPSFPCGPYIWGVKAIYSGNRLSTIKYSNILGKCWTAPVTVQAGLSCVDGDKSGTGVQLKNLVYPDTMYTATMDTSGMAVFPSVWRGTYELKLSKFGYQNQILTLPVSHDTVVTALLLQEKPVPKDLEVGETNLIVHWQVPEYEKELFAEDWSSGSFSTHGWTTEGGSNWVISTADGNPAPAAMFSPAPQVFNYTQSLISAEIDPQYAPVLLLRYDIFLDNFGTTTVNQMAVEIWDGSSWTTLSTFSNSSGDIPWQSEETNISAWSGQNLKIRFQASGGDSYDINQWNIDNIRVVGSETQSGLTNCILGYNVYLNNVLSGFTPDTKYIIPGEQVEFGQTYDVCVSAVYGSGWSPQTCVSFTSSYLFPPRELTGAAVENSVELEWEKPEMTDSLGQLITPPGLLGYRIYRNGVLLDSIASPDSLNYYDLQLNPGNYQYEASAWYDLTDYGFPGEYGESMKAGPVEVVIDFGRQLPFIERWEHGTFEYNNWDFVPSQGNWGINTGEGNPAPSTGFTMDPLLTDYKYTLETPSLDGSPYHCGTIYLDFDLAQSVINPTGQERLTVMVFYDNEWHTIAEYTNDSSTTWTSYSLDITEVAGKAFRVGFTASGSNSADILFRRLDNIYVYPVCFGPTDLQVDVQGYDVHLSWRPPDCTGSNMYLNEGFEGELFPPESWSQTINNGPFTWSQMNALSPVGVHSGDYSAGLLWDYTHQDEWLIAENVIVNGDLTFWSYAYQHSVHLDHYYVKISDDEGLTWTVLLDMSALPSYPGPGGYNQWNEPYVIDLSSYMGKVVSIAWNAVDGDGQGLWYPWAIDDCYIGADKMNINSLTKTDSKGEDATDGLLGYDIFRKDPGSTAFIRVNTNVVSDTFYIDSGLPAGQYTYYITPVFFECTYSETSDTVETTVITATQQIEPGNWKVFPVPASGHLTVEGPEEILSIDLLNVEGRLLRTWRPSARKVVIDINNIPSGVYLLKVLSPSACFNKTLIFY